MHILIDIDTRCWDDKHFHAALNFLYGDYRAYGELVALMDEVGSHKKTVKPLKRYDELNEDLLEE